jgi:hypothetical protein
VILKRLYEDGDIDKKTPADKTIDLSPAPA